MPPPGGRSLHERLRGADTGIVRLVESCLQVDPRRRPTAAQLLTAPYFCELWWLAGGVGWDMDGLGGCALGWRL